MMSEKLQLKAVRLNAIKEKMPGSWIDPVCVSAHDIAWMISELGAAWSSLYARTDEAVTKERDELRHHIEQYRKTLSEIMFLPNLSDPVVMPDPDYIENILDENIILRSELARLKAAAHPEVL